MVLGILVTVVSVALSVAYLFFKHKFSYWERRNVPFLKPEIPFGNIRGMGKTGHIFEFGLKFYNELKGKSPFGGIYFSVNPVAVATDLDFIKNILIKDFQHFQDRGVFFNEEDDPLSAHLFSLEGQKWKSLRSKLSPTFTSGKMKFMFPTITEVAAVFQRSLSTVVVNNDIVEIKEILSRFTTDVIGTCAFGINCNSLHDPNAQFRTMGRKFLSQPRNSTLLVFLMGSFRNLARKLRMKVVADDVAEFFMGIVDETVAYREKNNVKRNDFMDILIELKNNGTVDGEKVGTVSIREIAAQAFVFFLAGFETSSTTMSFCLYELAKNLEVQEKVRQEINTVLAKNDGKFTYDAMMQMNYLDSVINETLRMYPPAVNLIRIATNEYPVPDTNYVLEKGTRVIIPIYAIQHDAEYFPNPEKFDPDRFFPAELEKRHNMSFLAFGQGPRNCIGERFGMMQSRIGLVMLLKNFMFAPCSESIVPMEFAKQLLVLASKDGIYLSVKAIK